MHLRVTEMVNAQCSIEASLHLVLQCPSTSKSSSMIEIARGRGPTLPNASNVGRHLQACDGAPSQYHWKVVPEAGTVKGQGFPWGNEPCDSE